MTRIAVRWMLAVAAVTLAACGGSQQQQAAAPPATAPAVEIKSPTAATNPSGPPPLTITFNKPTTVKADCQAALSGGNDSKDPKNEIVDHGDTVKWKLVNGDCAVFDAQKVNLHFNMHVFTGGNNLGAPPKSMEISDVVDDKAHTGNGKHQYVIEFDHKDAGDPDIDVNDCGHEPPAK